MNSMPYFVYVLSNATDDELYKGFTENLEYRLRDHNSGYSLFTSTKGGWQYIGIFEFESKKQALIFEKKIKKWNRRSLDLLLKSESNLVDKYSVG